MSNLRQAFFRGAGQALPFFVVIVPFAMLFGVLCAEAGIGPWETQIFSIAVFAGASQLVAVQMFDQGATLVAIATAVFAVNARHILMGATLTTLIRDHPRPLRWLSLFLIVDESWALTMAQAKQVPTGPLFLIGATLLLYPLWLVSTVAGVWLGDHAPDPRLFGLDFLGVAVFIGMLALLKPSRANLVPFAVTAVLAPLLKEAEAEAKRALPPLVATYHGKR